VDYENGDEEEDEEWKPETNLREQNKMLLANKERIEYKYKNNFTNKNSFFYSKKTNDFATLFLKEDEKVSELEKWEKDFYDEFGKIDLLESDGVTKYLSLLNNYPLLEDYWKDLFYTDFDTKQEMEINEYLVQKIQETNGTFFIFLP